MNFNCTNPCSAFYMKNKILKGIISNRWKSNVLVAQITIWCEVGYVNLWLVLFLISLGWSVHQFLLLLQIPLCHCMFYNLVNDCVTFFAFIPVIKMRIVNSCGDFVAQAASAGPDIKPGQCMLDLYCTDWQQGRLSTYIVFLPLITIPKCP